MTRTAITGILALGAAMLSTGGNPAFAQAVYEPFPPGYVAAITALCRSAAQDRSCTLGNREWSYWSSFETVVTGKKTYTAVAIGRPRDGGMNLHGHALFRSYPAMPGHWSFAGEIVDASDNWAGCDRDTAPESCHRSSGKLALTGKIVAGWPELRSTQAGTLPAPDSKARRAKPADGSLRHFSPASRAYETDSPQQRSIP